VPQLIPDHDTLSHLSTEILDNINEFGLAEVEEFEIYKIVCELAPKNSHHSSLNHFATL
jgi:hypothetical protein